MRLLLLATWASPVGGDRFLAASSLTIPILPQLVSSCMPTQQPGFYMIFYAFLPILLSLRIDFLGGQCYTVPARFDKEVNTMRVIWIKKKPAANKAQAAILICSKPLPALSNQEIVAKYAELSKR